jgi:hypothetical protein
VERELLGNDERAAIDAGRGMQDAAGVGTQTVALGGGLDDHLDLSSSGMTAIARPE